MTHNLLQSVEVKGIDWYLGNLANHMYKSAHNLKNYFNEIGKIMILQHSCNMIFQLW